MSEATSQKLSVLCCLVLPEVCDVRGSDCDEYAAVLDRQLDARCAGGFLKRCSEHHD